jgi:hypothetical protein
VDDAELGALRRALLDSLEVLVRKFTGVHLDGREIYIGLRAYELSLADFLEKRFNSAELAHLQGIAFEISKCIRPVELDREDAGLGTAGPAARR